jgi:DNA-binding NarL/FixJ family response regulator
MEIDPMSLAVDVISDVICPWCYVGKRRLERAVAAFYLSEAMTEARLQRSVGGARYGVTRSPLDVLADRELEVFRLIGEGVKTAEIAERLHLSVKTVETYRDRIRQKLDLSDGMQLAHYATQWIRENG